MIATADLVIPTIGRPSLAPLLEDLALAEGPLPDHILVVDDRRDPSGPLFCGWLPERVRSRLEVVRSYGRGPAAARNTGWRASTATWIAFLDDDVRPDHDWPAKLAADLALAEADVGAVQGRVRVPLPAARRPTDWERNVGGLEGARWTTADIAYRREALSRLGGFDERFTRAFREDAELALRTVAAGWRITTGERAVRHPVRLADPWISVRLQVGNRDDALMRTLHGRGWHGRAGAPVGRRPRHLAIAGCAVLAIGATLTGHRLAGAVAAAGWLAGTLEFAWARIKPGPRGRREARAMLLTSAAIPPVATWHWLSGVLAARGAAPLRPSDLPDAVFFDRDGTLITDLPYNGDPDRVSPMPGAREALARLRRARVPVAVVTNQSGLARGTLSREQVDAVNRRIEALLGPIDAWLICPHGPEDSCACRKPAPGLILTAARQLGADPSRCVVIGDVAADVYAAQAVGARGILVPTPETRPEEVAEAVAEIAPDLATAVELALCGAGPPSPLAACAVTTALA
jgi:histidinol-phosphate phosphatase family protein